MVKVYSDKTNKFYNTVEEATRAEFELKEKKTALSALKQELWELQQPEEPAE